MKTEDLIRAYMKEHHRRESDTERKKTQVREKPIRPVSRKGK